MLAQAGRVGYGWWCDPDLPGARGHDFAKGRHEQPQRTVGNIFYQYFGEGMLGPPAARQMLVKSGETGCDSTPGLGCFLAAPDIPPLQAGFQAHGRESFRITPTPIPSMANGC